MGVEAILEPSEQSNEHQAQVEMAKYIFATSESSGLLSRTLDQAFLSTGVNRLPITLWQKDQTTLVGVNQT